MAPAVSQIVVALDCGCSSAILKGSWDLVTRVISKVTILITYNPN